ncbi:hypothetical protein ADL35_11255, partial [Streptomyces sp. NRRL WC-3753]
AAASTGGAYNSGSHGAYGRLAAWQSLAALPGTPERFAERVTACLTALDAGAVPAALLTLGLESLAGAGRKKAALSVSACPPGQAWRVLFAAASTGGAYNSGSHGAYGRLAAWQSLAALPGTP